MELNQIAKIVEDLRTKRIETIRELAALEKAIESLEQISPPASSSGEEDKKIPSIGVMVGDIGRFSPISMRWSCLWILSEASKKGLSTAQIASKLAEGGRSTSPNTVSAVLSNMKAKKEELSQFAGNWTMTPSGEAAWANIRKKLVQGPPEIN